MKTPKMEEMDDELILEKMYDLEYRDKIDDAWYSVYTIFSLASENLTIKYLCSPMKYKTVVSVNDFKTASEVDELVGRFRKASGPLQDFECRQLAVGTAVCVGYGKADEDLRFYDAVIEEVDHKPHLFPGDVCKCNFVLFWLHGPPKGQLTSANIASICIIRPVTEVDSRVAAFARLAKEKIVSKSVSVSNSYPSPAKGPVSDQGSKPSEPEIETGMVVDKSPLPGNEDSEMAPGEQHFIALDNLEKDLTPMSIIKFILNHTGIEAQASIFPTALSNAFATGAIMVDCQKKLQKINEFLEDPKHLVVSSKGRPWAINAKAYAGTLDTVVWSSIHMNPDNNKKTTGKELQIVRSGTDAFEKAKQLRDLCLEFIHHGSQVSKRFGLEEEKIQQAFKLS